MKTLTFFTAVCVAAGSFCSSAVAQSMTTAAEVKPILSVTKPNWIAVRPYDGRDLLYFTNLLSWRCGVEQIFYTVNDGDEQEFVAEPCYEDESAPNALKAEELEAILRPFELNSVQSVEVRVVFDDGTEDSGSYLRKDIEIQ